MNRPTIKGFFLKLLAQDLRSKLTQSQIEDLTRRFGDWNYSAAKNYDFEHFYKIQDAVRDILYPDKLKGEQWEQTGRDVCNVFLNNPIGATFLAVAGKNISKIANSLSSAMGMIARGVVISIKESETGELIVTATNLPHPPEYLAGVIYQAFTVLGQQKPRLVYTQKRVEGNLWEYVYTIRK